MDCNRELRDETETYGSWFNHMVDNMVDYENDNYEQIQLLKTLHKQLGENK